MGDAKTGLLKEEDVRYVTIDGETFAEWNPKLTPEEEQQLDTEAAELVRYNSVLRQLRESLGMTQEAFAELLGVTQSNVSKIEAKREPRLSALRKLVEHKGGKISLLVELGGQKLQLPV